MALQLGNLLGAVSNIQTALSQPKSLKQFLSTIDELGLQVANNFEVNFSGIDELTFYITDFQLPEVATKTTTINYKGRQVIVPTAFDYGHEFTLNCMNDASGVIYSTLLAFISSDAVNKLANSGYTMTIKALADNTYNGATIILTGVRLLGLTGLSFGHAANEIQTFSINCWCQEFTVTPGAVGAVANVIGAANSLIG